MSKNKCWPANCVWPEPIRNLEEEYVDTDLVLSDYFELDEGGKELLDIREYMDEQVELGRLNPDYTLNEEYDEDDIEPWEPEKGENFWNAGFLIDEWEDEMTVCVNRLKLPVQDFENSPVVCICRIIGYNFINENILRQAFTRRAFQIEYGLAGCSEELEFFGDTVLNTVVTREIYKQFTENSAMTVDAPFKSKFDEGDMSKMRSRFIGKEHLAKRAKELGLDRFILFGTDEKVTETGLEDMMEALIGAVAVDSDWNWLVLEEIVDRLINVQLKSPEDLIKPAAYELLNSWHQKHFGCMPEYEIFRRNIQNGEIYYDCSVRYFVPDNDKGINTAQRIYLSDQPNRTAARERAAEMIIAFVRQNGLWVDLKSVNIEPKLEDAINQLQELKQKKYVDEPVYSFNESSDGWRCECNCSGVVGYGMAASKTKAKKKAAYMVIASLFKSSGIYKEK